MKLLFASDSFKGSLSSRRCGELLRRAAYDTLGQGDYQILPVADGGEGSLMALSEALEGEIRYADVHDPLGRSLRAPYFLSSDRKAFLEMAEVSGLTLLKEEERDPLETSTFGFGELIRDALNKGAKEIYLAIGGSATNDGGTGALRALGWRFLSNGKELEGKGKDLKKITRIDKHNADSRIADTRFVVLCDVNNPLTGPNGATYVYGPQKGAGEVKKEKLEQGMCHYRELLIEDTKQDPNEIPGAGAAGGIGAAFALYLHAEMTSGCEAILNILDFDKKLKGVDYLVTGEGKVDEQTASGKLVSVIAEHCQKAEVPCAVLCGQIAGGEETLKEKGVTLLRQTKPADMETKEAMEKADSLYRAAAKELMREIREDLLLKK